MTEAIMKEIRIQRNHFSDTLETIYFGGGTPSVLSARQLRKILSTINSQFESTNNIEITLEANPDDLDMAKIKDLKAAGINRLSIGIQSFSNDFLSYFNRAHDAEMAQNCVTEAKSEGFSNISIDLIFGIPGQTIDQLQTDLDRVIAQDVPHISIYGLTIEDKTAFGQWYKSGKLTPLAEENAAEQFELIMDFLEDNGYTQYEISNFAKSGYESRHNSSYWYGKKYLGVGPSAHSYDGSVRYKNISHNIKYIASINQGQLPHEKEVLSVLDKINETIMIELRTIEGIDTKSLSERFNIDLIQIKADTIKSFVAGKHLDIKNGHVELTKKGRLLADHITEKLLLDAI